MNKKKSRSLTIVILISIGLPGIAVGQTNPRIMLEKSASYALDNELRAFRVPVTNSDGVIRFYDITVTLGVDLTGIVDPNATVVATRSPAVRAGAIAPGSYLASDGTTCTVTNIALSNGRIQSFFPCLDGGDSRSPHELTVASGTVFVGHPFLTKLLAAEINTHPDVNTFIWGLTTNGSIRVGTCAIGPERPVGAKTDGNQLILSFFNIAPPGEFFCNVTFTKVP